MAEEIKKETEKLHMEDLDQVSGGTYTEFNAIKDALENSAFAAKYKPNFFARLDSLNYMSPSLGSTYQWLDKMGIEADISDGVILGWGSKNNTYKDKETGMMLMHSEVMNYIRTGKKSWLG